MFRNVKMKYRHNLSDALNKVSFEVEPEEKVGIVGRTGSGKSSLFLALFRMVEIYKGSIFIDGIDLIHLDLKDIRYDIYFLRRHKHNVYWTSCRFFF